jgi:hypothetical protein
MTAMPERLGPRHQPLPHIELIERVEHSLQSYGLHIVQEQFGSLKDGSRFFGLLEINGQHRSHDYTTVIGLRGSHDSSIAAGIVAGSGVFVCDNLCFSGEVKIGTKQTTFIRDRLPEMVDDAVSGVGRLIEMQHDRFESYKKAVMPKRVGDAAITEMVRRGALPGSKVGHVIEQWDTPDHPEFAQDGFTAWRLHNAVTDAYKPTEGGNTYMGVLPNRSQVLTEFCDELAGVNW